MRAIEFRQHGPYEELRVTDLPRPEAGSNEVLVRLTAAAINPIDDLTRLGFDPVAKLPPLVPGVEGAGIVEVSGLPGIPVGTRVIVRAGARGYGLSENGTWQEYVTAPAHDLTLIPLPEGIDDISAAGLTGGSYLTAQYALCVTGGFRAGQIVLVTGAGGAVGNAAAQLARAQGAARVLVAVSSTEKADALRERDFPDVIDGSRETLAEGATRLLGSSAVDLALDSVGGEQLGQVLGTLRPGGTLVSIGATAGMTATVNLMDFFWKGTRVLGLNLFAEPEGPVKNALDDVLHLVATGLVRPEIARTFPLEQAALAQRFAAEERPFGKVVLTF